MYIRASLKMHKNLKISLEVGEEITEKTLPLTMKTWYCAICMCYDCEKHKPSPKVTANKSEYISRKNKISETQHIQQIIKLLRFYEGLKDAKEMRE
jgi:hypothetical protein